jgi:hypothetical protein
LGRPLTPGRSGRDGRAHSSRRAPWPSSRPSGRSGRPTAASAGFDSPVRADQDTGGAIRGPGRVDFFWGRGEDAAFAAGLMRQPGVLLPRAPRRDRQGAVALPTRACFGPVPFSDRARVARAQAAAKGPALRGVSRATSSAPTRRVTFRDAERAQVGANRSVDAILRSGPGWTCDQQFPEA